MTTAATKSIIAPALRAASVHVRSSVLPASISKSCAAHLSSVPPGGKATLPDLPYDYAALSPVISAETMELHHTKHHNAYVTNLNIALEKLDSAVSAGDVSSIIGLQGALKFNGGGHLNHALFWENLCAKGSVAFPTSGPLKDCIAARFGDVDNMKKEMSALCVGVQGSGWGWLGYDAKTGECSFIILTKNNNLGCGEGGELAVA
jgi:Fe-Mn family superoxide dismutase